MTRAAPPSATGQRSGGQPGHAGHTLRLVAPPALVVTAHRAAQVCCPCGEHRPAAPCPPHVARPVQYGPRVEALGRDRMPQQVPPYGRAGEVLADLPGCPLAVGTRPWRHRRQRGAAAGGRRGGACQVGTVAAPRLPARPV